MNTFLHITVWFVGITASVPAFATASNTVPEPGVIELLAAAAVAGVIVWVRNRRK